MTRPWSPYEIGIMRRYYPREGNHTRHRLKHRTRGAVRAKAQHLGLSYGDVPGYIQTSEVHPKTHKLESHTRIIREAKRDGVLETLPRGKRTVHIVPVEWADAYVERLAVDELKAQRTRVWLKSADVSDRLGCNYSSLMRAVNRQSDGRIRAAIRDVRTVRIGEGFGSEVRWHPSDVEVAARKYRHLRRLAAA